MWGWVRRFHDPELRSELLGPVLLVLLIAGVASVVAGVRISRAVVEIEEIAQRDVPLSTSLTTLATRQLERNDLLERIVRSSGTEGGGGAARQLGSAREEVERLGEAIGAELEAARLRAGLGSVGARRAESRVEYAHAVERLDRIAVLLEDYRRACGEVLRLAAAGRHEEAASLLQTSIDSTEAQLIAELGRLASRARDFVAARARHAEESERAALAIVIVLLAAAVVTGPLLGPLIAGRVGRALAGRAAEVRVHEARLRSILSATADGIIAIDEGGAIQLFNRSAERIFGYRAAEVMGRNVNLLMPPPYREEHDGYLKRYLRTGERHIIGQEREVEGRRKDGSRFPMTLRVSETRDDGERLFIGTVQDISDRKAAQESLRRSEERYRTLFEESRDAIVICAREGWLVDGNPAWWRLVGEEFDHRARLTMRDFYADPADHDRLLARVRKEGSVADFEVRVRRRDETEADCLITASARRSRDGALWGYQAIVRDVTERKRLEGQLIRSQRLEAVGQLAGGLAHDFNNMLMAIMGSCELLTEDLKPSHPAQAEVETIGGAARRAADLVRQLLVFSRRQVLLPRIVDLNAIVSETELMLRRLLREDIELVTLLDREPACVKADPGQLEQVVVNLAMNARDAMPRGGRLTIGTATVELDEAYARTHHAVRPGAYVLLAVSDTGEGMDEETQARIFEPFFTTKEEGQGTGLGLAMVYGIVKQSGGHIWVYSEPERGTSFKVYLPRAEGAPEVLPPVVRPVQAALTGTETVLLVENETAVRAAIAKFMRKFGYTVLEACDGPEALELTARQRGPIDVVVTDIVMPRMRGPELVERLARLRPGVKVLYMSGYADPELIVEGIGSSDQFFLQKPFPPKILLRKLREVIDRAPSP